MKSPGGPMEVDKEPVMRPSSTSAYLLDNARRETSKRFDALSVLYDGDTIRHLENRRVSEGWSCLEVGGGGGSIAAWLVRLCFGIVSLLRQYIGEVAVKHGSARAQLNRLAQLSFAVSIGFRL